MIWQCTWICNIIDTEVSWRLNLKLRKADCLMCTSISMQHMHCCKLLKLKLQKRFMQQSISCFYIFTNVSLVPRHHRDQWSGNETTQKFQYLLVGRMAPIVSDLVCNTPFFYYSWICQIWHHFCLLGDTHIVNFWWARLPHSTGKSPRRVVCTLYDVPPTPLPPHPSSQSLPSLCVHEPTSSSWLGIHRTTSLLPLPLPPSSQSLPFSLC